MSANPADLYDFPRVREGLNRLLNVKKPGLLSLIYRQITEVNGNVMNGETLRYSASCLMAGARTTGRASDFTDGFKSSIKLIIFKIDISKY